jgi:transcriptional regulator with XRE-family HTH domain
VSPIRQHRLMDDHPIKSYRDLGKLSQQGLADRLGVTKATVSRWEAHKRKISPAILSQISARTGIPPQKLRADLAALMEPAE